MTMISSEYLIFDFQDAGKCFFPFEDIIFSVSFRVSLLYYHLSVDLASIQASIASLSVV